MSNVTSTKVDNQEFQKLFGNSVQFGGKTIKQSDGVRLSDGWIACKTNDNIILTRPVSKSLKSHGVFTITVDGQSIQDGKLDDQTNDKTIAKMSMLDIVAQSGKKNTPYEIKSIFDEYIKLNGVDDILTTFQFLKINKIGQRYVEIFKNGIWQSEEYQIMTKEISSLIEKITSPNKLSSDDVQKLRKLGVFGALGLLSDANIEAITSFHRRQAIDGVLDTYCVLDPNDRESILGGINELYKNGPQGTDKKFFDDKKIPKKAFKKKIVRPLGMSQSQNVLDHNPVIRELKDGRVAYLFWVADINTQRTIPYLHIAPKKLQPGEEANHDGVIKLDILGEKFSDDSEINSNDLNQMKEYLRFFIPKSPQYFINEMKYNAIPLPGMYCKEYEQTDTATNTVVAQTSTRTIMPLANYINKIIKYIEKNKGKKELIDWIKDNRESMLKILSDQKIDEIENIVGKPEIGEGLTEGQKLVKNAKELREIFLAAKDQSSTEN